MARLRKRIIVIAFPIILYLIFLIISPRFDFGNLPIVAIQMIIPTLIGYAFYQCMAGGMFDLSIGARIILSAYIGAELSMHYGVTGLVIGCMVSSIVLGAISGALYTFLKIPSMVLAMCLILIYEPLPVMLFKQAYISINRDVAFLGKPPYSILIALIVFILFYIVSYHTEYSSQLRAIGSEENLARTLGIKTNKVKFNAYLMAGFLSGFVALLYLCYSNNISSVSSLGSIELVFKPLMGVMIAMGFAEFINIGVGILIGEFSVTLIFNGLIALGLPNTMQDMVLGLFLLIVIAIMSNRDAISMFFIKQKTRAVVKKS